MDAGPGVWCENTQLPRGSGQHAAPSRCRLMLSLELQGLGPRPAKVWRLGPLPTPACTWGLVPATCPTCPSGSRPLRPLLPASCVPGAGDLAALSSHPGASSLGGVIPPLPHTWSLPLYGWSSRPSLPLLSVWQEWAPAISRWKGPLEGEWPSVKVSPGDDGVRALTRVRLQPPARRSPGPVGGSRDQASQSSRWNDWSPGLGALSPVIHLFILMCARCCPSGAGFP